MRYSISGKQDPTNAVRMIGGQNIAATEHLGLTIATLTNAQVRSLKSMGYKVKEVKAIKPATISVPPHEEPVDIEYGAEMAGLFKPLRESFSPTLTGAGLTVAVLDSGIRETHIDLQGKIVHARTFAGGTTLDVFSHGTGVASIITAISPGASIMNMKVLSDLGAGTEEYAILAIDEICGLVKAAIDEGKPVTDPMYPNVINLSLGSQDDGDYDNALRAACRTAWSQYGVECIAAAGNSGPDLSTIMNPACDPSVIAVGGMSSTAWALWRLSSHGPTLLGDIKPDFVAWCEYISMASVEEDTAYVIKSGTSFSTPMLSGARGLLDEMVHRKYGGQYNLTWNAVREVAPLFCAKAVDAPLGKDNGWGYGLPLFGSLATGAMPTAQPVSTLGELLPAMVAMMMMPMLMKALG